MMAAPGTAFSPDRYTDLRRGIIRGWTWWFYCIPWFYSPRLQGLGARPGAWQDHWVHRPYVLKGRDHLDRKYRGAEWQYAPIVRALAVRGVTSVLDAGTGEGHFPRYLWERYRAPERRFAAFEFSEERLANLRVNLEGLDHDIEIARQDILRGLTYPDRSFDAVACLGFFPCFDDHLFDRVAQEILRVTGKYLVVVEGLTTTAVNRGRPHLSRYFEERGCTVERFELVRVPFERRYLLGRVDAWPRGQYFIARVPGA